MPVENLDQRLAESIKTVQAKNQLVTQIENLANDLARISPPTPVDIEKNYPNLYKVLREQFIDPNKEINHQMLTDLKDRLQGITEVMLNTSVGLDNRMARIENIAYAWCRECVNARSLVNALPSKELTAGITCSYMGQYRDFSLDKIIRGKIYG